MGFSVSASPSYLYQSPSGYIFRLRIPCDLRKLVGKTEFRYSLRAGALRIARHRARFLASSIQQLFSKMRDNMTDFTPEQITQMVKEHTREVLGNNTIVLQMPSQGSFGIGSSRKSIERPRPVYTKVVKGED
jgi:hypothetical protein